MPIAIIKNCKSWTSAASHTATCPECDHTMAVYHLDWAAIICGQCEVELENRGLEIVRSERAEDLEGLDELPEES